MAVRAPAGYVGGGSQESARCRSALLGCMTKARWALGQEKLLEIRLIPIKGVVGTWPSDVGSLLAMCLVRMRDPSALARRCSSRPLIAFDDPFDVPRRAVTRPLRRLVGQAHRVAVLRRAPSAIPAGPVVAGAGFGNVRRGLRGRVRGASQSNSWAPSVA